MSARAAYPLALALLAAAPLAAFLGGNAYPLARPEAAALLAGAALLGALLGLAVSRRTLLGPLVLATGLALCLDFLYRTGDSKTGLVLVPLACAACALALRRHAAVVVVATAATFLAGTVLIPATSAGDADRTASAPGAAAAASAGALPVLLHLVLDEHVGLDGVPRELPQGEQFRRWLSANYVEQGFRVHAGAYSEYFDTRNSLANLLNFTSEADPWAHLAPERMQPFVLARSAYFRHLTERGYALRVYQSDHIDLCRVAGQPYASCLDYHSNSIRALEAAALAPVERMRFILNSFLETSAYAVRLRAAYANLRAALPALPLPAWTEGVSRVGPLAVLPVLERLEADLRTAKPGEAYFAHLLIPHYPYVLDESCRPHERIAHWLYNLPADAAAHGNSAETRAERYRLYFAQVRCQQRLLARLFDALKAAGVWERAVVVVHGDHGSRITRNLPLARNAARLTRADFDDAYSALFAVRMPGARPGEVAGARPLQALLGEVLGIPVAASSPRIYLRSRPDEPLVAVDPGKLH